MTTKLSSISQLLSRPALPVLALRPRASPPTPGFSGPSEFRAVPDYDGSVYVESIDSKAKTQSYPINLCLAGAYRAVESFPIVWFCGRLAIEFPFGNYYLTKSPQASIST